MTAKSIDEVREALASTPWNSEPGVISTLEAAIDELERLRESERRLLASCREMELDLGDAGVPASALIRIRARDAISAAEGKGGDMTARLTDDEFAKLTDPGLGAWSKRGQKLIAEARRARESERRLLESVRSARESLDNADRDTNEGCYDDAELARSNARTTLSRAIAAAEGKT